MTQNSMTNPLSLKTTTKSLRAASLLRLNLAQIESSKIMTIRALESSRSDSKTTAGSTYQLSAADLRTKVACDMKAG